MSRKDKGKDGYLAPHLKILLKLNFISLTQFKNYIHREFRFNARVVAISGPNGIGKTNLLDAIYYLGFTKSYFSRSDAQNAHNGFQGFRIEGHYLSDGTPVQLLCIVRETGRKEFLVNGDPYERFAQHVGRFPCVMIAPDDIRIITEGSEERRRYIDTLLSQLDPAYLQSLITYNKILQQRNGCLRSMAEQRINDRRLLDVYDEQLAREGEFIFEKRRPFMEDCRATVKRFYHRISGSRDDVALFYESQLSRNDYPSLLAAAREKDILLQRTTVGVHKDDIVFTLNGQPFKSIASQGQRKSLLFALKLAEFDLLQTHKKFPPLLLLDDVFEKLDENRMHNLLEWVCVGNGGQIFITDTHAQRIHGHMEKLGIEYELIEL